MEIMHPKLLLLLWLWGMAEGNITHLVNITIIFKAAFLPVIFRQKNTNKTFFRKRVSLTFGNPATFN
jgi:hypothetical protein